MVSKMFRRQVQVLALIIIALALLAFSAVLTFLGFSTWHFFLTRPYHEVPMSFYRVPYADSKPATLEAVADLKQERLHSVASMEATISLSLPESHTNLENSVFQISSYLLSSDEVCVAHASSTATLTFRSPAHRVARAVVLFVPMLLGITREYQQVTSPLFRYTAIRRKGVLPKLVAARVKIHTDALQIESAELMLRVGRTGLFTAIVKEGRLSTLCAITVGLWYCMLFSFALLLACVSATRRAIIRMLDTAVGRGRELGSATGGVGPSCEAKGSPPRQILIGHGDRLDDAEIGRRWASVCGFT